MPPKKQAATETPAKKNEAKPKTPAKKTETKPTEEKPEVVAAEENQEVNTFTDLLNTFNQFGALYKTMQAKFKAFSKEYEKQQKFIEKEKKKRENAKKSLSGFSMPTKISDELCEFMGVEKGTLKSRTEVAKYINDYVKKHDLHEQGNRRNIKPDGTLQKIFKVGGDEKVSFFSLQKLLSPHFPKSRAALMAEQLKAQQQAA
eukprot:325674-Hanusia_phi.AAC.4